MNKVKIDFSNVSINDLKGAELKIHPTFQQDLGNILYTSMPHITVSDLGRKIFEAPEGKLELNIDELSILIEQAERVVLVGWPLHLKLKQYLKDQYQKLIDIPTETIEK